MKTRSYIWPRVPATLSVLAMLAGPAWGQPAAGAGERQRVAVVASSGEPDPALTGVIWGARALLDDHPALSPVDLAMHLGGGRPHDPAAIRDLLDEGRAAFEGLDIDEAEKDLSIAALLASGRPTTSDLAVQALAMLARLRAAQKDERGAVRAFVRLLRLRPSYQLPPEEAAPSATRRLDAARTIIDDAESSRLRIEVESGPAAVFVDGALVGISPLYLADIAAGTHHVRVAADGLRDDRGLVDLEPGRESKYQVAQLPADKADLYREIIASLPDDLVGGAARDALESIKGLTFADQAIIVRLDKARVTAALFDLRAYRRVKVVEAVLGQDPLDVGRRLVRDLYRGVDPRSPGLAAAPVAPPEPEEAGQTRWWLWSSIAAGVVVAASVPVIIWALEDDQGVPKTPGAGSVIVRF